MTEHSSFTVGFWSSGLSTLVYTCSLTPFDVIKNTQINSIQTSPLVAAKNLLQRNGMKSFWRGMSASLVTHYSSNIIYYPLYEFLRPKFEKNIGWVGPGVSALICRFITVCSTMPVERLRTTIQAKGTGKLSFTTYGLRATLTRDLIFSFSFFMIMENMYNSLKENYPNSGRTISCSVAALFAGVITHPFDVIKTKIQARYCCYRHYDKNTYKALLHLWKTKGFKSLFIGFQPRISKIVFGLILYINIYEYIKKVISLNFETEKLNLE